MMNLYEKIRHELDEVHCAKGEHCTYPLSRPDASSYSSVCICVKGFKWTPAITAPVASRIPGKQLFLYREIALHNICKLLEIDYE